MGTDAESEIQTGDRFAFGENWERFLDLVDEERIERAQRSLEHFLGLEDLTGKTFLDVGSGSGLSSLAARRMGALVTSFDYDPGSVACTREMRRLHDSGEQWSVKHGSILDRDFVASLGQFDIVYSWGVLHHTGDLWAAVDTTMELVAPDGLLWIALYNDQGTASRVWTLVKKAYNNGGPLRRRLLVAGSGGYFRLRYAPGTVWARLTGKPKVQRARGMDRRRDLVDWVGGWPFEVSKPEQVLQACRRKGFELINLRTMGGGLACNEYLFHRRD